MTSADLDDIALLRAHVEGDPDAFTQLVTRHRDRLWAVALRTAGDPEDAADALQEALISAFRRADSYREEAQVSTWLHRIVVNACLDRLRRRSSRFAYPLQQPNDERDADRFDNSAKTEPVAETATRRVDVWAALNSLSADQRAALVLVDVQGYSVNEAARILSCPPGTVKSRCSRGRARLARLLASYGGNRTPGVDVQYLSTPPSLPTERSSADQGLPP